jgi:hypothetical protein
MPDDGMTVTNNEVAQQFEVHVGGLPACLMYERTRHLHPYGGACRPGRPWRRKSARTGRA